MSSNSHYPKSHAKLHTSNRHRSSSSKLVVMRKTQGAVTLLKPTCDPSLTLRENSKRALCIKDIRKTWRRTYKLSHSLSSQSQWMSVRSCSKLSRREAIITTVLLQTRCHNQWMYDNNQIITCIILQVLLVQQFKDHWTFKRDNTPIQFRMEQHSRIPVWSTHRKWTQQWLAITSKTIAKFLLWPTTCSRT